ncbi:MAG: Zn-dependent alcohol dehydrogenase, partial [Candidatus Rokuibacteriota bacterium]
MRASFYEGARRFRTGTAPEPSAGAGEALLHVKRVGICGTDLHIFQGHLDHRVPKGGIIGHETFAEVVEAPAGSGFEPGNRVVVEPIHSCGECRACKMGGYYLCYALKIYGVELPGGMQDYWTVPAVRMLHVPDTLGDDQAAMIEPLAVATHDVRRAEVKAGDAVLVLGGGPIGALIAMVCRHRGARVIVSEVNPFRIDLLRGLGLEVIGMDADPVRFVNEWTAG